MTGTIRTDGPPEHADGAYRRGLWDVAFGLQSVDGLEVSAYVHALADENVSGRMTLKEVGERLDDHYRQERSRTGESTRVEEADKVSYHIVEMLEDASFSLDARMLNVIHEHLFQGIDDNKYAPGVFKSESLKNVSAFSTGIACCMAPLCSMSARSSCCSHVSFPTNMAATAMPLPELVRRGHARAFCGKRLDGASVL